MTEKRTRPFVMVPQAIYAKEPSKLAMAAYVAIRSFASPKTGTSAYATVPMIAARADMSENSFQKALAELVKKGTVNVYHRTSKTLDGKHISLPNLYEIVDLDNAPI